MDDADRCETFFRSALGGLPKERQVQIAKRMLVRLDDEAPLSTVQMDIIGRYTREEADAAKARAQTPNSTDGNYTMSPAALSYFRKETVPPKYQRPNYGRLSDIGRVALDRLEHYMRTQVVMGLGDPTETYLRAGAVWFAAGFRARDDFDAFAAATTVLEGVSAGRANEVLRDEGERDPHRFMFYGRWFASGAPRVRLSSAQAAALMLTDLPPDFVDSELRPPWPAFVVELPDGLLPTKSGGWERRALVHRMHTAEEDCLWWITVEDDTTALSVGRRSLFDLQREDELYGKDSDGKNITILGVRLHTDREVFARFAAVAKLVAGILYKMQETPPAPIRVAGGGAVRRKPGGPPQTTDIVMGFPVNVDFSNLVREHILGHVKRLAKVQWLVRGHWRNQACGEARSVRRRIWIQPFWKGPLDAPILVRAHVLKDVPPEATPPRTAPP